MKTVRILQGQRTGPEMVPPAEPSVRGRRQLHQLDWRTAIRLFLEGWGADHPGIRPATLHHYEEQLQLRLVAFAEQRGVTSVEDFDRFDLRAFVAWVDSFVTWAGRPLSPRGKQMALDTAKRFLGWLHGEKLLDEDVTANMRTYRLDRDMEPRATPTKDFEKILSTFNLSVPGHVRDAAMVHLMALCGLRVSELVGLNGTDLSLEEGRVRVRAEVSKSRRARSVDLPLSIENGQEVVRREVASLMRAWLQIRSRACPDLGPGDALFVTLGPGRPIGGRSPAGTDCEVAFSPARRVSTDLVRRVLKQAACKAGVDPRLCTPHRLRHFFGLTSAKAGVPTTALMRAMGHRNPTMTARYSIFADSERRWAFARADIARGVSLQVGHVSAEPGATED